MKLRVRSRVKSVLPSSVSIDRNNGSPALGRTFRTRCNFCQRASTVAGERLDIFLQPEVRPSMGTLPYHQNSTEKKAYTA
jgi:hypothetical protein